MREFLFVSALAAGLVVSAGASQAQEGPAGFRTPSGNVHCRLLTDGDDATLRCDIRDVSNAQPPRPRNCELEWGQAFEIAADGEKGARICHGDTVTDDALPVLAYGGVWRRDGFSCLSEQTGLSCANDEDHGFELARNAQRVF